MKKNKLYFGARFLALIMAASGCAPVADVPKVIWGSSTRALEEARAAAIRKTFRCDFDACFDAVLKLIDVEVASLPEKTLTTNAPPTSSASTRDPAYDSTEPGTTTLTVTKKKKLDLFIKDRRRKLIVVMGVPGNVNTTEVGIFFTPLRGDGTGIDISSLSSSARVRVAEMIFQELGKAYEEVR